MIDPRLEGKVVLVTGANNPLGIGAATARAFAAQGAAVFLTYLRRSPATIGHVSLEEALQASTPGLPYYSAMQARSAQDLVREIRDAGGEAVDWEADLSVTGNTALVFEHAEVALGPIDVLVNNAAYHTWPESVVTATPESIDGHFGVNTRAVTLMMGEFVRRHKKRGATWGRIINLSTDSAQCFVGSISYGASKAATEALTRSVACEVGPLGITVNTVAPGPVQTGSYSSESVARERAAIPLGRMGRPEDIADAIVFLASEQARWMTGQVIKVSGGHAL